MVTTEALSLSPVWQELIPSLASNHESRDSYYLPQFSAQQLSPRKSGLDIVDPLYEEVTLPLVRQVRNESLQADKPITPDTLLAFSVAHKVLTFAKLQPEYTGERTDKIPDFINHTMTSVLPALGFENVSMNEMDNTISFTCKDGGKEFPVTMDLNRDMPIKFLDDKNYSSFMLYGGFRDSSPVQDRLQAIRRQIAYYDTVYNTKTQILYWDSDEARRKGQRNRGQFDITEVASYILQDREGSTEYKTYYDEDITQPRIPRLPVDYSTIPDLDITQIRKSDTSDFETSKSGKGQKNKTGLLSSLKTKAKELISNFSKKLKNYTNPNFAV